MNYSYIFLTTRFEEIEALTTIDILRRGQVNIKSVSLTGDRTVVGGHGIAVVTDCLFEEVKYSDAQMLILPGGTVKINEHDGLKFEIIDFAREGKLLAAICAAPMVFGGLGLLKGRQATCYPGYEKYLKGAKITGAPVTVDGNFITGKTAGYTVEFALELLSQLKGKEVADEVAQQVLVK
jgi:4-methyl-5(b-hydroxyethyl)-thiazole monophosphate biosynthesis